MLDPFFAPIPAIKEAITPLCDYLHLRSLPLHFHEVLFASYFYHAIFAYLAPPLSSWLLPNRYTHLSPESKLRWNMHCASMVQCCTITMLALWTMYADDERRHMDLAERMWGYTGAAGLVQALAAGYFLFDLVVMLRYLDVFGLGMLAHACSCLATYTLGFVRSLQQVSMEKGKCLTDGFCSSDRFSITMGVFSCSTSSPRHS